jgi:hypothetical protein
MSLQSDGEDNQLFADLKKKILIPISNTKYRKAANMRAAVTSFVNYHSKRPQKFVLNIELKPSEKWERPAWTLKEFSKVLGECNRKYRPLFRLGAMVGFGRKELEYLNQHLKDVNPVTDAAGSPTTQGVYLEIPGRKQNSRSWKALLPKREIEELQTTGPILTTWGTPVDVFDLTQQFTRSCERAGIHTKGTSTHVIRSVFRTVGGSLVPERYLEWNMGHFDRYHYDRNNELLKERAEAMQPLWDYTRRGGPPTVNREEVDESNRQLLERIAYLEKRDLEREQAQWTMTKLTEIDPTLGRHLREATKKLIKMKGKLPEPDLNNARKRPETPVTIKIRANRNHPVPKISKQTPK